MKYIGFDLGSKTLGISVSDPGNIFALSYDTIFYKDYEFDVLIEKLDTIIVEEKIDAIVLGMPYNMSGTMSTHGLKVLEFKELLSKYDLPIYLEDERLTSSLAHSYMNEAKIKKNKQKKLVDNIAASIILQSYLDKRKNEG